MRAIALFAVLMCAAGATSLVIACTDDEAKPSGGPASFDEDADTRPAPPPSDAAPPVPDATTCSEKPCTGVRYDGLVTLAPCCAANGACGVDPKPLGSFLPIVPDRCIEAKPPGKLSFDCNVVRVERDGSPPSSYDGCCRANNTCGIAVKVGKHDFGCQLPEDWIEGWEAGAPAACDLDAGDQ